MKGLLRRIWMVLTWPFRMIAAGFRAMGRAWKRFTGFFTEVPEEVSLTETVSEALSGQEGFFGILGGLGEHIDAMRMHILRSVIAMAITTGISFLFADSFDWDQSNLSGWHEYFPQWEYRHILCKFNWRRNQSYWQSYQYKIQATRLSR